jgi:hypothetical protein
MPTLEETKKAIEKAIQMVGFDSFKATSMFMRNSEKQNANQDLKAA